MTEVQSTPDGGTVAQRVDGGVGFSGKVFKATAGQLLHGVVSNVSGTGYYMHVFDLAAIPAFGVATAKFVARIGSNSELSFSGSFKFQAGLVICASTSATSLVDPGATPFSANAVCL